MYNHQLDTFLQVADAGSFSKAGEALYISPTAVMKQVNLLESTMDVQLFDRTPRVLTLTNAGKCKGDIKKSRSEHRYYCRDC